MKFLQMIDSMQRTFPSKECGTRDNARLYGIIKVGPPLARHIIYYSLDPETMNELCRSYKRTLPHELLELYKSMNGADLFWTTRRLGKLKIPSCQFSIYGVPASIGRTSIEPFNISIEDLKRPLGTPDCWLKFGSYCDATSHGLRFDLFVDTENSAVFAVPRDNRECEVERTWQSIDSCLCDIFELLSAPAETTF